MPQKILTVIHGLIQIWIKVPVEFEVWYFEPVRGTYMLVQINELCFLGQILPSGYSFVLNCRRG